MLPQGALWVNRPLEPGAARGAPRAGPDACPPWRRRSWFGCWP